MQQIHTQQEDEQSFDFRDWDIHPGGTQDRFSLRVLLTDQLLSSAGGIHNSAMQYPDSGSTRPFSQFLNE